MLGHLDLARADTPTDSPVATRLEKIGTAAKRATGLVDQILAFSRQSSQERRPLRLQLILKEVLMLLRSSLPSTSKSAS